MKIEELRPKVRIYVNEGNQIATELRNNLIRETENMLNTLKGHLDNMKQTTITQLEGYMGDLDENSIKNLISATTRPLQTKMQEDISNRKKLAIQEHVEIAFKQLNKKGEFLDQAVKEAFQLEMELENLDLSIYEDNSLLGGLVIGSLGLGIGALLAAPVLIPIGIIGAFLFGSSIKEAYLRSKREQELRQIKGKIQNGFENTRKDALNKFEQEWLEIINEIVRNFQNDYHEKALLLEEELTLIIREKQEEQWNVEEKRKYYEGLISSLQSEAKLLLNTLKELDRQKAAAV